MDFSLPSYSSLFISSTFPLPSNYPSTTQLLNTFVHLQAWELWVKDVQLSDAGHYECQLTTHPPVTFFFTLKVTREYLSPMCCLPWSACVYIFLFLIFRPGTNSQNLFGIHTTQHIMPHQSRQSEKITHSRRLKQ